MKTVAIIQARIGSTRLPGKVLMPLATDNILAYCVKRAKLIKGVSNVIVATTSKKEDEKIVEWCKTNNIEYFCGSENDVLQRYVKCAEKHNPDYVIRLTSDNPFFDYETASNMLAMITEQQADIVKTNGTSVLGFGSEIVSYKALLYMDAHGTESHHREHVTSFGYEFQEMFKTVAFQLPYEGRAEKIRLTVDTPEDYQLAKELSHHFQLPTVTNDTIISYLINENPRLLEINAHIVQKMVK